MLCRCTAAVSDRVGAGRDLISTGQNGYVFPCGDVNALAAILHDLLTDPLRLRRMGQAGRDRMDTWSPRENIEALIQAVERAIVRASPTRRSVATVSNAG
jgi:glycosyltransferase involved in cell wall biosynthesis